MFSWTQKFCLQLTVVLVPVEIDLQWGWVLGMSVQEAFQDLWQPEVCLSYWSCGQVLAELHGTETFSCPSLTKYGIAVSVIKYRMIKKAEMTQFV